MGVHWYKRYKKWRAFIRNKGKQVHLGYFDNVSDAVNARVEAEKKHNYHPNHGGIYND